MTTPILFRFHKEFDVCAQNVRQLRRLNPEAPIHGMYGGAGGIEALPASLTSLLDSVWAVPFEDPAYNWKNGDLCARWWFKDFGHRYDFAHLAIVEWDLVYLMPLTHLFGPLDPAACYMSLVEGYHDLVKGGWPWVQGQYKWQVDEILKQLAQSGRPVVIEDLTFGVMGGCILSRRFLELYAKETVCSYTNDEVRMAVYAKAFGLPLLDNGLISHKPNMFDALGLKEGEDATLEAVQHAIAQGAKAVHPVRVVIDGLDTAF